MRLGQITLGRGRTFIIAEIGGNHEGDFNCAQKMIREAATAGADAVKFQMLRADRIVASSSKKAAYSGITHQQQWERFRKIEFTKSQYRTLKRLAAQCGVLFMASVFDPETVDEMDDLLPAYKIASGDLTYYALLRHIRKKNKPVLLSTGASSLTEIQAAVRWLGKKDLAILHCICSYPAPHEQMNLKAIPFLRKKFGIPVGFSDHSKGIECALAAVALGACVIEKHFTLDKSLPKGDHRLSVNPPELKQMVDSIRIIEKALGDSQRPVYPCEKRARPLVRRSLYASRDLRPGAVLKAADMVALRPLAGIPAEREHRMIGRKLSRLIRKGSPVKAVHLGGG